MYYEITLCVRGKEAGMAMVKGERGEELGGKREGEDKRKDRGERRKGGGGGEGREVEREDR